MEAPIATPMPTPRASQIATCPAMTPKTAPSPAPSAMPHPVCFDLLVIRSLQLCCSDFSSLRSRDGRIRPSPHERLRPLFAIDCRRFCRLVADLAHLAEQLRQWHT